MFVFGVCARVRVQNQPCQVRLHNEVLADAVTQTILTRFGKGIAEDLAAQVGLGLLVFLLAGSLARGKQYSVCDSNDLELFLKSSGIHSDKKRLFSG